MQKNPKVGNQRALKSREKFGTGKPTIKSKKSSIKKEVTSVNKKSITEWTIKEFESLPYRAYNKDIGEFDSLVVLPTKRLHDSGFRCMDFVAIKNLKPLCRLSGGSDVLHFDGIGGYGYNWLEEFGRIPTGIKAKGWCIDCLPKSGLLHIFTHGKLRAGTAFSSFDLFAL